MTNKTNRPIIPRTDREASVSHAPKVSTPTHPELGKTPNTKNWVR